MDPRNFDADLMSEMFSAMGKELKLARAKIKSLEDQDNRSTDFKARAESAENALGILKKNFEDVCREKQQLQTALDDLRDSKTGVKKEEIEDVDHIMAPPSKENHLKLSPSMELADADRVQDLERALEIYYRKYKEQKKSKNQLREASRELEEKLLQTVSELDKKNDELESKAARMVSTAVQTCKPIPVPISKPAPPVMSTEKDVFKYMARVPEVPSCSFKGRKFKPVCGISMDLKAFLSDDTKLKEVATNLLCLPGRLTWCPPTNQHAFAVAPLFTYNSLRKTTSKENDAFKGLYGQNFHLFYTSHDLYYYGGFYKAVDLRSETPHGISLAGSDLSWKSIAAATLRDDLDSFSSQTSRLLATLYQEGVLKVQILGLQCLGFNADIYNMLTAHYDTFRSVMKPTGKFGGYFPDSEAMRDKSEGPKKKKQKISAKF